MLHVYSLFIFTLFTFLSLNLVNEDLLVTFYSSMILLKITIVQIKERNNNNDPFLGRKHNKQSKLNMCVSFGLQSLFKLLDIEEGKEKLFNSNIQAANFLNISK